jgi:hypothetical protein
MSRDEQPRPTQEKTMPVKISPAELAATRAKIAKINARAAKRGFTGRFTLTADRVEETSTNLLGFTVTEVFYSVTVDGEAPSYNGWTFQARVDRVGESFTLATAPGVDYVARDLVRPGQCDHCKHNRPRKYTYLVKNAETGEVKQVGSTCLKDFLGWDGSVVFVSTDEVAGDLGSSFGGGPATYDVDSVLAVAFGAIRAFGFRPSNSIGATAQTVRTILSGRRMTEQERIALEPVRAYADEANAKVATIKAWILSDDFNGQSTYVDNLKVAAAASEVTDRQIGLLASAPQAYVRHLETAEERTAKEAQWAAEKAARTSSEYVGTKGDKIEIKATIVSIRFIPGQFATTVLYKLRGDDGNLFAWFASREALGEDEGVSVALKGTIKNHEEYEGTKQTVLTRCKVAQS